MNCEILHMMVSFSNIKRMIRVTKEIGYAFPKKEIKMPIKKETEQHVGYHIVRTGKRTDF